VRTGCRRRVRSRAGGGTLPALQFHLPQPGDERLRDVTAILAADPGSDRTLAELGRAVGAGERTLSRLFRAETATTCGYSTPSAFHTTPGAYCKDLAGAATGRQRRGYRVGYLGCAV